MHKAISHHPPTDTQPAPGQQSWQNRAPVIAKLEARENRPALYPEHNVTGYGTLQWPVWAWHSGCAPSQLQNMNPLPAAARTLLTHPIEDDILGFPHNQHRQQLQRVLHKGQEVVIQHLSLLA